MIKEFNLSGMEWMLHEDFGWKKERDIKEFIKLLKTEMPKKCTERGQFNETYFEAWLKKRAGEDFI